MCRKIKVLFLAADPFQAGSALQLDEQVRAIGRAMERGPARDTVELISHLATRTQDIREALLRHQPHVVHLVGHGGGLGAMYLGDEHGHPQPVDEAALGGLLRAAGGSVRVVVLDGCGTMQLSEALSEVVDYTVSVSREAGGEPAIVFAQAFYSALAAGCTVLAAFELGVAQLELEETGDAAMPVRRIRRGVNLDAALVARPDAQEDDRARTRRSWRSVAGQHPPGAGFCIRDLREHDKPPKRVSAAGA